MRVGVLTGGGDCPGLNAVIRAVVRKGVAGRTATSSSASATAGRARSRAAPMPLDVAAVRGILPRGGTILGSSRTNPFKIDGGVERIKENLAALGVDALIAIGGEDTLGVATKLTELGVHVVGVPKTIDNDLAATDYTFGFDTAVNIAIEAIDRLHTTAESHHRVLVVEVMGRHAGWIALHAGIAGGANVILIPEEPFDVDEVVRLGRSRASSSQLRADHRRGRGRAARSRARWSPRTATLDAFGHVRLAGIGDWLAEEIEERTGKEARTDGARPHPARRHADRVRPGAGDPVRPARDRRGARRATGARWSRCRAPTSSGCRSPRRPRSSRPSRRSATPRPRSSSAEPNG